VARSLTLAAARRAAGGMENVPAGCSGSEIEMEIGMPVRGGGRGWKKCSVGTDGSGWLAAKAAACVSCPVQRGRGGEILSFQWGFRPCRACHRI